MSIEIDAAAAGDTATAAAATSAARATVTCQTCSARVTELRRGRCWGCYARWEQSRPVGRGAACAICRERRHAELRLIEVQARSWTLCHSCAGRVARVDNVPSSVEEMRKLLARERRAHERREEAPDGRIFPRERRVDERRGPPRSHPTRSDENGSAQNGSDENGARMLAPEFDEIIIELNETDIESIELTEVRKV